LCCNDDLRFEESPDAKKLAVCQPVPAPARFEGKVLQQIGIEVNSRRLRMKVFAICCAASLCLIVVSGALGADAEAGRRLAQLRCAACHIVVPNQRDEVADAPPFAVIGRKFGFNLDSLVFALVGPHAKMNFGLTKPEANDVAAYIATLAR
jgi:hypothetical protein